MSEDEETKKLFGLHPPKKEEPKGEDDILERHRYTGGIVLRTTRARMVEGNTSVSFPDVTRKDKESEQKKGV